MDPKDIIQQFSQEDKALISQQGISLKMVERQLSFFKHGFPPANLVKNVSSSDGVLVLDTAVQQQFQTQYEKESTTKSICKFVPASGAASRMFRSLFAYLQAFNSSSSPTKEIEYFFAHLQKFAFYDDLKAQLETQGLSIEALQDQHEYRTILQTLLLEKGLKYGMLPKALLKFHKYPEGSRTALEEHLVEGANYCIGENQKVFFHFTVSEEHISLFDAHLEKVKDIYEKMFGVHFHISMSTQNSATNTIAVDMNLQPFRDQNHQILFRPGGHGALLENLNEVEADIVFIKNIDNVVPDHLKPTTYQYKKILGGILLHYQTQIYQYLADMAGESSISKELEEEIIIFLQKDICFIPPKEFKSWKDLERKNYLVNKLNRPIRICGILQSTGKTGGGPYWVEGEDGSISLQLVETPQIDMDNPTQKHIFDTAKYFNITDLACSLKDFRGNKFNLLAFRDEQAGFISQKSKDGRDLKAQELPGLWNGSMADWNTVFVEVPTITFNPVKTVMDLLDETHQNPQPS